MNGHGYTHGRCGHGYKYFRGPCDLYNFKGPPHIYSTGCYREWICMDLSKRSKKTLRSAVKNIDHRIYGWRSRWEAMFRMPSQGLSHQNHANVSQMMFLSSLRTTRKGIRKGPAYLSYQAHPLVSHVIHFRLHSVGVSSSSLSLSSPILIPSPC